MRAAVIGVAVVIALVAGCGGSVPRVTPELVASARTLWPDADEPQLAHGRELYVTRCSTCHALPLPREQSDAQWPATVRSMAKRAKLDQEGQDEVLRFILAARRQ